MFDKLIDKIRLINKQIGTEQDPIVLETQLDLLEVYTNKLIVAHKRNDNSDTTTSYIEPPKKEIQEPVENVYKAPEDKVETVKENTIVEEVHKIAEPIQTVSTESVRTEDETTKTTTLKEEPTSINERFSAEQKTIGNSYKTREGKNLKKLIDINERFSFINNLFDGDVLAYDKAIKTINNHDEYQEAMAYIRNELKHQYSWSLENPTVARFLQLVRSIFQ